APTPTESQLAPPRPPTPQTPTGAPQQPESPAPHVPSHGPHQPRRTAPAPPWAKMPIGEPPPAPSRPSASPAEPPTRPAPQHSRRARRGHRYRTDTERNVGKVATGPSIQARLRAEEASGAQLAPGTEPSPAPLGQPRSYL
ncbi:secretion protein EspI, partial [Mycobacterium tuberculosis]